MIFTLSLLMLQSSFGFIDYFDRRSAAQAILSLNGKQLLSILGLCMLISVNTLLLLALNAKDSPQNQVWSANKCQLGIYKYSEGGYIRSGTERCLYYISIFVFYLFFQVSCRYIDMKMWFLNSNDKLW